MKNTSFKRIASLQQARLVIEDRAYGSWRRGMRREIGWFMLAKLAALLILWALFFSPAHRHSVDGRVTADRFALVPVSSDQPPQIPRCGGLPCD
jgi:hypothetical protein